MTSLLLFNHFYPVISYRRDQKEKESDELLYTVWSLVMVRQLPAQGVKITLEIERGCKKIRYSIYVKEC